MIIREAKAEDAAEIVALLQFLGHPVTQAKVLENLNRLASLLETPFIAEENGQVLGLIGVHIMVTIHRDTPVGRIPVLVVREDLHGRGIGRNRLE